MEATSLIVGEAPKATLQLGSGVAPVLVMRPKNGKGDGEAAASG
jgi:hypothetical protein